MLYGDLMLGPRGSEDCLIRRTGAAAITITPALTITGAVTMSAGSSASGDFDVVGALTAGTIVSDASIDAIGALTGGTIASDSTLAATGLATFNGGATVAVGQTLTVNSLRYDYDVEGIKAAPENKGGRPIAQKGVNDLESLAVTGAVRGDNVSCRNAQVPGVLTVNELAGPYLFGPKSKALTAATATTFVTLEVDAAGFLSARIPYTIVASDGTDYQVQNGLLFVVAVNKAGTVTTSIRDNILGADLSSEAPSTGMTEVFTAVADGTHVDVKCAATSGMTETLLRIHYRVEQEIPNTVTAG